MLTLMHIGTIQPLWGLTRNEEIQSACISLATGLGQVCVYVCSLQQIFCVHVCARVIAGHQQNKSLSRQPQTGPGHVPSVMMGTLPFPFNLQLDGLL